VLRDVTNRQGGNGTARPELRLVSPKVIKRLSEIASKEAYPHLVVTIPLYEKLEHHG
jgi:hypothetical protein